MTVSVGFSKAKGVKPFSWLIMAALRTPYSHTYLRFTSNEMGSDMVFQASSMLVNFMSYAQFLSIETVYKEFPIEITEDQFSALKQLFISGLGQPYSLFQILNTAFYIALGIKPLSKYISGWDCSKLMENILLSLGYKMPEDMSVVTPKDVYEYVETL